MTDDPPPPKRRRKPPKGLEGFDTGFPEDEEPVSAPLPSVIVEPAAVEPAFAPTTQPNVAPEPLDVAVDPSVAPESQPHVDVQPEAGLEAVTAIPAQSSAPIQSYSAPIPAPYSGGYSQATLDREEPLSAAGSPDLREAVGARSDKRAPDPDLEDFEDKPRSRKTLVIALLSGVVGLGIAAIVFLGQRNAASFYLSCEPDKIVAERGRAFPPWGESALDGKQWSAIKIPPEAECAELETEDEAVLSTAFRGILVKRASVLLTAKEVTKTDEANALLEQALLHARSDSDASRNARTDIQRLLGDVAYWRASLKMRDASKALLEAAKQFDTAAQQRPRHVTDASAWAEYVRKVVGELEAGPAGTTQTFPPTPPSETRPQAPAGVALPVEPTAGSASEAPAAPPDAGLPTGGVLL